jgi:hypothetical protein
MQRHINNNSTVTDKFDCGGVVQEAFFTLLREAYLCCKLRRFKDTLKMEAIYSSKMSVLTRATQYKVPEDMNHVASHLDYLKHVSSKISELLEEIREQEWKNHQTS